MFVCFLKSMPFMCENSYLLRYFVLKNVGNYAILDHISDRYHLEIGSGAPWQKTVRGHYQHQTLHYFRVVDLALNQSQTLESNISIPRYHLWLCFQKCMWDKSATSYFGEAIWQISKIGGHFTIRKCKYIIPPFINLPFHSTKSLCWTQPQQKLDLLSWADCS